MSHAVEIETEVRDSIAAQAACRRLGLPNPAHQTVQLYSALVTGLAVQFSGWRYPAVCDLTTGRIQYDNFGGIWKGES